MPETHISSDHDVTADTFWAKISYVRMPGRLPASEDFPSHVSLTITAPPNNDQPVNILLLLHGLGDTNDSFTRLGSQLALPETCCISLRAPTPLPFELGGYHWGDDMIFDPASGDMEFDTGFSKATKYIQHTIMEEVLVKACGYQARDIMFFGFGQGGMAALAVAMSMVEELGGIISISGPLSTTIKLSSNQSKTPVLLIGGASKTLVTRSVVDDMKKAFQALEYHKWAKSGDGMPQSREEMMPIMRFFSRRLRSRKGVPDGSVEVG